MLLARVLISVFILIVLFGKFFYQGMSLTFFNYFDEAFLILFFPFIIYKLIIKSKIDMWTITLLSAMVLMFIISIIGDYFRPFEASLQILIHLRLFFYFYLIRLFFNEHEGSLDFLFKIFIGLTILGLLFNLILYTQFNALLNTPTSFRYGLLRQVGFQLSYNNVALSFTVLYIYMVLKNGATISKLVLYTSALIFISLITGNRTCLAVVAVLVYFIINERYGVVYKGIALSFIGVCFIGLLYYFKDSDLIQISLRNISDISVDSGYIRGLVILISGKLFFSYFPFGSGSATFGSILSIDSPHYRALGIDISKEYIQGGIFDSNFATIMGEFGLVGLALFSFLFRRLYLSLNSFSKNKLYHKTLLMTIIVFSLTHPVVVNGFQAMLFAVALNLNPQNRS